LVSKAGKYKTTKITALCNEHGQIQQFELANGGQSDHKAVLPILPYIPKQVYVTLDRGYDSKKLRRKIRYLNAFPVIPKRQQGIKTRRRTPKPFIYKLRWIVEQAFSKTDQFRKLLVRHERNPYTYKQYWYFGLAWLEIQKLTG
jgi:transposase